MPDDHPLVQSCEDELKKLEHQTADSVHFEPCTSPVWDTAIVAIALHESGLASDHPALTRAADWLLRREIRFRGDWQFKNPAAVEPSGWVFEFNNKWNPDVDDTAMVLLALRKIPTANPASATTASAAASTGCSPSSARTAAGPPSTRIAPRASWKKSPSPTTTPCSIPNAPTSPPASSNCSATKTSTCEDPQVRKALEFIREHQEADGSWYGRWGVNYIYGTWQVLRGLRALGLDLRQPWLLKARDWLESVQHEDGGWGERCDTYDDPVFKGQGPSTASQTAWAVMGLCAFDDPDRPSIQAGMAYLVRPQNPDGTWTESEATGTGFPRVFYLKYDMYRNSWPLLALATYRNLFSQSGVRRGREAFAGPGPIKLAASAAGLPVLP